MGRKTCKKKFSEMGMFPKTEQFPEIGVREGGEGSDFQFEKVVLIGV